MWKAYDRLSVFGSSRQDKKSMLKLLRLLDRVIGYSYLPKSTSSSSHPTNSETEDETMSSYPLPQLTGIEDIADVQERWIDRKEVYDAWEKENRKGAGGRMEGVEGM